MKILSFDIEDWFHVLDNPETANPVSWGKMPSRLEAGVDRILTLLSDTDQPATFFCLGWVAEKYPNVINEIRGRGLLIGIQLKVDQTKFIKKLMENKLLTIRAAENVVRILPPLNVKKNEIDQALKIIKKVCVEVN